MNTRAQRRTIGRQIKEAEGVQAADTVKSGEYKETVTETTKKQCDNRDEITVSLNTETVEPPATGRAEFPALAASGAVFSEVSGTESDSAAAAMSNTDIPVKRLPEVSSTETNPVSGEEEITVGEGNVMMEENSDAVMMETEQVAFKTH
ncbi:hypothetical protein Q7C36_000405 [Tachysurus vachellii]|uniref:Uncharacterized protein n=1 Tax=Tachysurus vachellii TaxID=175792 RepID=A0AA88TAF7_TACVA|nr:hypothetical protein Q7C36_000405 [Tachysurus vachellii]